MVYKKSPLKATRLRKHKRNVRITIVVCVVVVLGGIIFLVWKLVRLQVFMISQINVQGNSIVASDDIQNVASNDLAGTYWHFFPKANRLWYPQDVIRQDILNDFPPIDFISFRMQSGVLTVNIEERQPAYVWCQNPVTASSGSSPAGSLNDCYFTDLDGYIFSPATASSTANYLILSGDLASSTPVTFSLATTSPIGQMYTSLADFKNIVAFTNDLSVLGLKVVSVASEGNDVYDAYLAEPGRIIFKATDDPDTLQSDIVTLQANGDVFSQSGTAKSGTSTLDYVDLRFGDKVYYKFE